MTKQIVDITLTKIIADPAAQPRSAISTDKIAEYVEDMARGDTFPPLVVFGTVKKCWLADGFHRFYAAVTSQRHTFECELHEGGLREAALYSCSANAAHGLRRTTADKRRAVITLCMDEEWSKWSNEEIARHCAVSASFVAKCRKEMEALTLVNQSESRLVRTKHGTVTTMRTAAIGRAKAADEADMPARIAANLKEIERYIDAMPEPDEAVNKFPPDQWYFFPISKIEEMANWLGAFAIEWRKQAERRTG